MLTALSGCSSSEPVADSQSSAILDGTTDDSDTGVVAIFVAKTTNFPQGGFCTGALVAPNVVLTARHCVSKLDGPSVPKCEDGSYPANRAEPPEAASAISVVHTTNAYAADSIAKVREVRIPPDPADTILCGHDIAILELAEPLDATTYEPKLDGPPLEGDAFSSVGYGYNKDTSGDGIRRRRDGSKVTHVGELRVGGILIAAATDWVGDVGPCGGDSGGPALDSAGRVMGIMSRGTQGACKQVSYSRVDPYADWIRSTTRDALTGASLPLPAWTTIPPSSRDAGADADDALPPNDAPKSASGCAVASRGRAGSGADGSVLVTLALTLAWARRRKRPEER